MNLIHGPLDFIFDSIDYIYNTITRRKSLPKLTDMYIENTFQISNNTYSKLSDLLGKLNVHLNSDKENLIKFFSIILLLSLLKNKYSVFPSLRTDNEIALEFLMLTSELIRGNVERILPSRNDDSFLEYNMYKSIVEEDLVGMLSINKEYLLPQPSILATSNDIILRHTIKRFLLSVVDNKDSIFILDGKVINPFIETIVSDVVMLASIDATEFWKANANKIAR